MKAGRDVTSGVAIVIPCFNQKRFLCGAIDSALGQTVPPDEVIVVDDGSDDDLSTVTGAYSGVVLIRQPNQGLAAARNTGLRAATSGRIVFLDADDRLLEHAVAAGLECFRERPDAAFVYGGFNVVTRKASEPSFNAVATHRELVRTNWIGMIATVMFDRARLLGCGGFDESLGMCEDWDAYLRLSRDFTFASHPVIVADYVRHDANASSDVAELRRWIEAVRTKEWHRGLDAEGRRAWQEGEQLWRVRVPDPTPRSAVHRAARWAAKRVMRPFRS